MNFIALTFGLIGLFQPPQSEDGDPFGERVSPGVVEGPARPPAGEDARADRGGEFHVQEDEEDEEDGENEADEEDEEAKKKKFRFKVRARVIAGGVLESEEPRIDSQGEPVGSPERKMKLDLRQARAKLDVRYLDILRVKLGIELADLLGKPQPDDVVRDAWGNIHIHDAFQIKVGHFKRPYSRLELRGVSKIPFIGRGLFNGYAVEDLSWGDRAVGAALWGKIKPRRPGLHELRWDISATNDAVSGAPHGVDLHARLVYEPANWLAIGGGGAYKRVQDSLADEAACLDAWKREPDCRRDVFAATADLRFKVAGFYGALEADLAQDWRFADTSPWMLGTVAYASYEFEVGEKTSIQPVVAGEYVDVNLSYAESEAVRAVGGLNVLWTKHLRILPQVQWVVPLQPVTAFNPFVKSWVCGLWVSVQL